MKEPIRPISIQYLELIELFEKIYPEGLKYVKNFDVASRSPRIYGVDMWTAKRIIDDYMNWLSNKTKD